MTWKLDGAESWQWQHHAGGFSSAEQPMAGDRGREDLLFLISDALCVTGMPLR